MRGLLEYYDAADHYDEVKRWYDGYRFGNVEVYCPWDVLNHCDRIRSESNVQPENYWINTSSNDAVKRFIQESANATTKREIERLVAGETIIKEIHQELTYPEIYQTIDNIWSLLFTIPFTIFIIFFAFINILYIIKYIRIFIFGMIESDLRSPAFIFFNS